jgi:hypothetical protein
MVQVVIIFFISAAIALADLQPTSRPVATKPSVEQLHVAAVASMRAGEFQNAARLLEQAYRAKPLALQSRPLVLNHAMLDIKQRHNVMRALKDLRDYMRDQAEPDDDAINLLGAALEVAAEDERLSKTDLARRSRMLLDEQIARIEEKWPGRKKWGNRWYGEAAFVPVKARYDAAMRIYVGEMGVYEQLLAAENQAKARVQQLNIVTLHVHTERSTPPVDCLLCIQRRKLEADKLAAQQHRDALAVKVAAQKLVVMKVWADVPRPNWTPDFVPIDSAEIAPPGAPAILAAPGAAPPATRPSLRE